MANHKVYEFLYPESLNGDVHSVGQPVQFDIKLADPKMDNVLKTLQQPTMIPAVNDRRKALIIELQQQEERLIKEQEKRFKVKMRTKTEKG